MNQKIKLKKLRLPKGLATDLPLFYQFIQYNELQQGDPFAYTEQRKSTQSLVSFSRPEKPVSKIIDYSLLKK